MASHPSPNKNAETSWAATLNFAGLYSKLKTVEDLQAFMKGELFAPTFRSFVIGFIQKRTASERVKGPQATLVLSAIELAESNNKRRFTKPDALKEASRWNETEWYGYVVARIVKDNVEDRNGIFYKRLAHAKSRYQTVLLLVRRGLNLLSRRAQFWPETYFTDDWDENMTDLTHDQLDIEATEGLTVVWRNRNNLLHGMPSEDDEQQYIANISNPWEISHLAALRNRIRRYFQLSALGLYIAFTFTLEATPESEEPVEVAMTEKKWRKILRRPPGQRGRVFILFDTTDQRTYHIQPPRGPDDEEIIASNSDNDDEELDTEVSLEL